MIHFDAVTLYTMQPEQREREPMMLWIFFPHSIYLNFAQFMNSVFGRLMNVFFHLFLCTKPIFGKTITFVSPRFEAVCFVVDITLRISSPCSLKIVNKKPIMRQENIWIWEFFLWVLICAFIIFNLPRKRFFFALLDSTILYNWMQLDKFGRSFFSFSQQQ